MSVSASGGGTGFRPPMGGEPRRSLVKMPDLGGVPLTKAKLMIRNAGLHLDAVLYRESYEQRNTVLEQKPGRGQMVYVGDRVNVWVARRGYVQFLPALYRRSDASGRNFVRDLLYVIEHLMSSVDDKLDVLENYFDPYEAPEDFVEWLASWTAMVLDMEWPEEKKRAIVKKAVELYGIRGTVRGLKIFLSLFTGHEPNILEHQWPFKGFRIGEGLCAIGIDSIVLPPVDLARCFIIEIPAKFEDVSIENVIRVHDIIQAEKPAHVSYYLRFLAESSGSELREYFTIGMRSGIGVGMEVLESEEDAEAAEKAAKASRAERAEKTRVTAAASDPKPPAPEDRPSKFIDTKTEVGMDQESIARARLAARKREMADREKGKAGAKDDKKDEKAGAKDDKKDEKDPERDPKKDGDK